MGELYFTRRQAFLSLATVLLSTSGVAFLLHPDLLNNLCGKPSTSTAPPAHVAHQQCSLRL